MFYMHEHTTLHRDIEHFIVHSLAPRMFVLILVNTDQHSVIDIIAVLLFYCSMSGHRVIGNPQTTFYSATKFSVTALTEGLRKELRDQKSNIKITVSLAPYVYQQFRCFIYIQ